MDTRRVVGILLITVALAAGFSLLGSGGSQFVGGPNVAFGVATTATSSVTVTSTAGVVGSVIVAQSTSTPAHITLTANATTSVYVGVTITDYNGCSDITGGTTTVIFYRIGETSSTCRGEGTSDLQDCYIATGTYSSVFASSSCSGTTATATTTFNVYYFAQPTDASAPIGSSTNWVAQVVFTSQSLWTASSESTYANTSDIMSTLNALNVTTSSINYGTVAATANTGATNQTTTVANSGNCTTTLQLEANPTLSSGANYLATSSQQFASTTFTYSSGTTSTALTGSLYAVTGFTLLAPTSTTNVVGTIYWGIGIPSSTPTGSYSGVNQFSALP